MSHSGIDAILFDLGGVVIELAGVEKMLEWSAGIDSTDELWRRWLHSDAVRRFETGATGRDAFAREVVAEFGVPVPPDEFLAAFTWWPRAVLPGAFELLAALRGRYRLASVSNTNEIHWDRFSQQWNLDAAFHHNFPSYLVGKLKPGVVLYRWKFVKPGSTIGMAYDGLAHVNGHWVFIPKPWRDAGEP